MAESILGGGTLIDIATAKRTAVAPARAKAADASTTRQALEKQLSDKLGDTDKTYAALVNATKAEAEAAIGERDSRISHLQAETLAQSEARRIAEVAATEAAAARAVAQSSLADITTRHTDLQTRYDTLAGDHATISRSVIQLRSDSAMATKRATEAETALATAITEHAAALERAKQAAPAVKTERKGYRLVITARDGAGDIRDFKLIPD